ncbi:MAG: hypothetical protein HY308_15150 [Gammaproteobacteria bacterium]|nr:hypothetical protein [Gammaproteobacteria bacterium]
MYSPVLSVPARRVSGWVAETDPKYAQAWLDALPLANSNESAREIYQALYTINRLDLRVQTRLELMMLYEPAVNTVCAGLHLHLAHAAPPLSVKKRQLAEFIRQLHIEMAYGYKCCLRDLSRTRLLFGKKARFARCIERALHHSSEVLRRSYLLYMPCPPGVWREMHELYRLAESLQLAEEALTFEGDPTTASTTIGERYVQALLLGLVNPYQLPHNGAQQVHAFLLQRGRQARVQPVSLQRGAGALFLIDLAADAPPVPLTRDAPTSSDTERLLDARELVHTLQELVSALERGEHIDASRLGVDCLDSTWADLLQRMLRAWGDSARRRYARQQRSSTVFVSLGLAALHFYANGQRPFAMYAARLPKNKTPIRDAEAPDVAFVELDEADGIAPELGTTSADVAPVNENHRVDRWQLRDVSPQGMSIARYGDAATSLRVGDLLGVQQPSDIGRWRAAVIRWIKSPESGSLEVGVEVLASVATPLAVRIAGRTSGNWFPGLRLPVVEVARRPSTLLLARGACRVGDELELIEQDGEPRRVSVLRLLERTGSFEQIVYADIVRS